MQRRDIAEPTVFVGQLGLSQGPSHRAVRVATLKVKTETRGEKPIDVLIVQRCTNSNSFWIDGADLVVPPGRNAEASEEVLRNWITKLSDQSNRPRALRHSTKYLARFELGRLRHIAAGFWPNRSTAKHDATRRKRAPSGIEPTVVHKEVNSRSETHGLVLVVEEPAYTLS